MPITLSDQYAFASNSLNNVRDSLVIMATTRSSRRKRLALGFARRALVDPLLRHLHRRPVGVLLHLAAAPHLREDRDARRAAHVGLGAAPDHGVPQIFWKGTKGGWKPTTTPRGTTWPRCWS